MPEYSFQVSNSFQYSFQEFCLQLLPISSCRSFVRVLQTTSPVKSYNHISLTELLILSHSNLYICPHIFKNFATFRKLEFPWRSFLDPSPNEHLLRNRNIFREQLKYYLLFAHDNVVNGLNPGVSVVCLVWSPVWVRVVFRKTVVGD